MKILITADPELPVPPGFYGGIERIIEVLIEDYVRLGHEVTLCANSESNVPCKLIPWKGKTSQGYLDTIQNISTLTNLVSRNKFDIIHSFSRLAYMAGIFHSRMPKIMSYQREPTLAQVNKSRLISRKGTMVFTGCSNYITNKLKTVGEAYTIYNCVPIEKYELKERVETDAPLMFLGRIEEIKGTHIAIEVAKKSKRKLIIAGNIPAGKEEYFNKMINPHLGDQIIYVGPVNDAQKNELLGKSAALLMPILWNEPFGIVMAESMACGTPILGFNMGSVPEIVINGVNGFICKNIEEMVSCVAECNLLDRKEIRSITERQFSNKKIINDYISLYQKLIDRKNHQ